MEDLITRIKNGENSIDFDNEKKEIKDMIQNAKNLGATKKNMAEIGKKLKDVYIAISEVSDE